MIKNLDFLPRPFLNPDGSKDMRLIHSCFCPLETIKGKEGQVCGRCGGAIPTKEEKILFKTR